MPTAYLNRIATAVPPNDVHDAFIRFAQFGLKDDRRASLIFRRMADKGGIENRYSYIEPGEEPGSDVLDVVRFYSRGAFPDTADRMRFFEAHAPDLAVEAVEALDLGEGRRDITHLLITCCTGLSSPGLDLDVIERCGLSPSVERTVLGFMGCHAGINALRLARHIVRSDDTARVLVLSLELTTLHLRDTAELERVVNFLLWGDGAAACLVTAEPEGFALDSFHPLVAAGTREMISWNIREAGFDILLSGHVPGAIHDAVQGAADLILRGADPASVDLWAVHPGGRSVVDAVERALGLGPDALAASRDVLRRYGNMSSATVMFILGELLHSRPAGGARGCAMSFGPGLVAETMLFHAAG